MKNMRSILMIAAGLLVSAGTAMAQKDFKTNPNGLKYKVYKSTNGAKPQVGDVIKFHFILWDYKDSMLVSSYRSGMPPQTRLQEPSYKGDLSEGFAMMSKGDSDVFIVSADSFYAGQPNMPVKPGTNLKVMIKMLDITSAAAYEEQVKKQQEKQQLQAQENKSKEANNLEIYLKEKAPNAKKTASGLYYVIESEGTGPLPQPGQKVTAHYTGSLIDGTVFDSDRGSGFSFNIGQHQVIAGWDEGFALMKKGTKARLIIPSNLGYGAQGAGGAIPPYATLVFEVELVDIQ